jgi:hypothetical protein
LLRHSEERSDEAIQNFALALDCFAPLAMTGPVDYATVLAIVSNTDAAA